MRGIIFSSVKKHGKMFRELWYDGVLTGGGGIAGGKGGWLVGGWGYVVWGCMILFSS